MEVWSQIERVRALVDEGIDALGRGALDAAQPPLERAVLESTDLPLEYPRAVGNLVRVHRTRGDLDAAVALLTGALDHVDRHFTDCDEPAFPYWRRLLRRDLAMMLYSRGDLVAAEREQAEVLRDISARAGTEAWNDPDEYATALGMHATMLRALGRTTQWRATLEQHVSELRRLVSDDTSQALHGDLSGALASLAEHDIEQGAALAALPRLREALRHADLESGRDASTTPTWQLAHVLRLLSRVVGSLGGHDEALEYMERAVSLSLRLLSPNDGVQAAELWHALAACRRLAGRPDEALTSLEQARSALAPALVNVADDATIELASHVEATAARIAHDQGDLSQARRGYQGALTTLARASASNAPWRRRMQAELVSSLGMVRFALGDRGGVDALRDGVAQHRALVDEGNPGHRSALAEALHLMGGVFTVSLDHLGEGHRANLAAVALWRTLVSEQEDGSATAGLVAALTNLGASYRALGEFLPALAQLDEAIALLKEDGGGSHRTADRTALVVARQNRAEVLSALARPGEALAEARSAHTLVTRLASSKPPDVREVAVWNAVLDTLARLALEIFDPAHLEDALFDAAPFLGADERFQSLVFEVYGRLLASPSETLASAGLPWDEVLEGYLDLLSRLVLARGDHWRTTMLRWDREVAASPPARRAERCAAVLALGRRWAAVDPAVVSEAAARAWRWQAEPDKCWALAEYGLEVMARRLAEGEEEDPWTAREVYVELACAAATAEVARALPATTAGRAGLPYRIGQLVDRVWQHHGDLVRRTEGKEGDVLRRMIDHLQQVQRGAATALQREHTLLVQAAKVTLLPETFALLNGLLERAWVADTDVAPTGETGPEGHSAASGAPGGAQDGGAHAAWRDEARALVTRLASLDDARSWQAVLSDELALESAAEWPVVKALSVAMAFESRFARHDSAHRRHALQLVLPEFEEVFWNTPALLGAYFDAAERRRKPPITLPRGAGRPGLVIPRDGVPYRTLGVVCELFRYLVDGGFDHAHPVVGELAALQRAIGLKVEPLTPAFLDALQLVHGVRNRVTHGGGVQDWPAPHALLVESGVLGALAAAVG